jgi:hypothetical protein
LEERAPGEGLARIWLGVTRDGWGCAPAWRGLVGALATGLAIWHWPGFGTQRARGNDLLISSNNHSITIIIIIH